MWFLAEAALIHCCLRIPHRNVLVTLVENDQIWTPESLHWTVKQISSTFLATRNMCFNWTRFTTVLRRTLLHKRIVGGGAENFGCVSSHYQKILKAWEYINKRLALII